MTLRALGIGLLWVVVQSAVMPFNEGAVRGTSLTGNHIPACSMIALLLLVLGVNTVWRKLRPGSELRPGELAVVWVMSSVAANIPFRGLLGFLIPLIASPHYMATHAKKWEQLILPHLKPWAIVSDERAARLYFEGTGHASFEVGLWLAPAP